MKITQTNVRILDTVLSATMTATLVLLSACSADVSKLPLIGNKTTSAVPADPIVATFVYKSLGANQTVNAPFYTTKTLTTPDFGLNSCSANPTTVEVIFAGTYDNTNTTTFNVTGVSSSVTQTSSNSFTVTACLPIGTSVVKFSSLNKDNVANVNSVVVSIAIPNPTAGLTLSTAAAGGFQTYSAAPSNVVLSTASGGLTLANISVGDKANAAISSTGNVGYSLDIGYVNMISNVNP